MVDDYSDAGEIELGDGDGVVAGGGGGEGRDLLGDGGGEAAAAVAEEVSDGGDGEVDLAGVLWADRVGLW